MSNCIRLQKAQCRAVDKAFGIYGMVGREWLWQAVEKLLRGPACGAWRTIHTRGGAGSADCIAACPHDRVMTKACQPLRTRQALLGQSRARSPRFSTACYFDHCLHTFMRRRARDREERKIAGRDLVRNRDGCCHHPSQRLSLRPDNPCRLDGCAPH